MYGQRTTQDLFAEACAFATILALYFAIGFGIYYVIRGAITNDWKVRKRTIQFLTGIWLLLSGSNLVRCIGLLGLIVPGVGLYLIDKSIKKNNKKHRKSQLVIRCPQCGRSLKGATQDMIGDIGVCQKCKSEFTIEQKGKNSKEGLTE